MMKDVIYLNAHLSKAILSNYSQFFKNFTHGPGWREKEVGSLKGVAY